MKKLFTLVLCCALGIHFSIGGLAQIGGDHTYGFLNLSNSARTAAMGGNSYARMDNDLSLAVSNPSLITSAMHNNLAFSFVDYSSDINYGFVSYGRSFKKAGNFVGSVQYINYGDFTRADATGEKQGEFTLGEYAVTVGWGRQLDSNFYIGANFKNIFSNFDEFSSYGMAVDVAGTYFNPKNNLTASLLFKNLGRQITSYTSGVNEPLPFEIQLGLSKKLSHVPITYSVLLTHLNKWDLAYENPNDPDNQLDPLTGEIKADNQFEDAADEAMRHIVLGAEFSPGKNFSFRLGYNYKRRQEMKVESKRGLVGFSWGLGLRIKKFNFSYSRAAFHQASSLNYITVSTNLSEFVRKN